MARIRTIKPEFWQDEKIANLSAETRLLLIALWCFADDSGAGSYHLKRLAAMAFPYDDNINAYAVGEMLKRLSGAGLLMLSQEGGRISYQVLNWAYWQPRALRLTGRRWQEIRKRVLERDGFKCQYCGAMNERLEADHRIPVSRGGSNDESNLVTACAPCNRSKHAKTEEEWRQ